MIEKVIRPATFLIAFVLVSHVAGNQMSSKYIKNCELLVKVKYTRRTDGQTGLDCFRK